MASAPGRSATRRHLRLQARATLGAFSVVALVAAAAWLGAESMRPGLGPAASAGAALLAGWPALRWLARRRRRVAAWRVGARWEQVTAAWLERLPSRRFVALHDRSIPGTDANVDHVVVAPSGVYTIETKAARGRVRGWRTLRIDGRRRPEILEQALWQAEVVERALGGRWPVVPVVCLPGASTTRRRIAVRGVHVVDGRGLYRMLRRRRRVIPREEVGKLATLIEERLPPA